MILFLKSILILVAFTACAAQTSVAVEKSKWGYRDPNEIGPEKCPLLRCKISSVKVKVRKTVTVLCAEKN